MADAMPVSINEIVNFIHPIADRVSGDSASLGKFVKDTEEIVNAFADGEQVKKSKFAQSYAEAYDTQKIIGKKSFSTWTDSQRGLGFRELAGPIAEHAQREASKFDRSTVSWANHPSIISLQDSKYAGQFFSDVDQRDGATVGFIVFLFLVMLALLFLCLLFC